MDPTLLSILVFALLFVLLAAGMPIGFAMGLSAFTGMALLIDLNAALALLGQTAYETGITYNLSVVPMFLLMGFIAGGAGLSEGLYRACNAWLGHRRGGLALATIGACGAFAAICGSSLATAATMCQIALPEMRRHGYDDRLATGAIAAGGTIGILIPPSVLMVLYGLLTETSISRLFLAGMLPGLLTVVVFMITISITMRINPALGPRGPRVALRQRVTVLRDVWGTVALFLLVIGGIYTGIFSPTEAASVGAIGALALAVINRRFSRGLLLGSLIDTVKTTAMIFTILIGAILLNNFLILAAIPNLVSDWITTLPLGPTAILVVILLLYVVLGCALDSLAMVLLTIPIFFPIIKELGYDPVWFGIIVVMVVELGLITPPIGMNVFVIKGIAGNVPLERIFAGVAPFVVAQVVLITILVIFPEIALWLPSTMGR
ncbi:TRAP transporter large permease [Desertibaculum subflavum]|uniref:TRAP transporter large permease n=1 Tax=Desertibaculum subflavum TaxID=2268458 RepID=UPI000E66A6B0